MRTHAIGMVLGIVVSQFENNEATLRKTVVLLNSPLSMHRREYGRALVIVVELKNDVKTR